MSQGELFTQAKKKAESAGRVFEHRYCRTCGKPCSLGDGSGFFCPEHRPTDFFERDRRALAARSAQASRFERKTEDPQRVEAPVASIPLDDEPEEPI